MQFITRTQLILVFVQLCLISMCTGFAFLAPIGVGLGSMALHGSKMVDKIKCSMFGRCCSDVGIIADFEGLDAKLDKHIYGQHLVKEIVSNALRSHWSEDHHPQKALTMSFHGWPGSGKNYVTSFIVKSLYLGGSKSKYVHHFIGRMHFPSADKVDQYQKNLHEWIKGNMSACPKQLFIFDEVDKMPPKILDIIKPMIDYRDDVEGVDYREAIFMFLSNTGAEIINEHFLELWYKTGIKREELKLSDFESLITKGSFNEKGGFQHSDTIKSNLIDHYVPFLPMERSHIRLCILDEFRQRNVTEPDETHIREAMEFIVWGPSTEQIFSTTGCKRISQKVGTIVSKYKLRRTK